MQTSACISASHHAAFHKQSTERLPSEEVSVVPVEPLGVDSEELKAEALF